MPRLPNISKYCVSRRSAAFGSLNEYSMLTPSIGRCCTPLTDRFGQPCRLNDRGCHVDDMVELRADFAFGVDAFGPVYDRAIASPAPVGGDLLGPLVGGVH